jgi:hypothetical protein
VTLRVQVRWETLNGNVKAKTFTDWKEAEEFGDRIEANFGTQWVDNEADEDDPEGSR